MKSLVVFLAVVALTNGKSIDSFTLEDNPVYGYMTKYGIPRAEELRKAEEKFLEEQSSRIVNGVPAEQAQVPWQAGLFTEIIGIDDGRRGVCGGSLISKNRVVTAAHCWFDGLNQAWRVTVVLGSLLLNAPTGIVLESTNVVAHPQWLPYLVRNDVAMIYLPVDVSFSNTISPISLPSGSELNEDFVGESAIVSGFGLTSDGGGIAPDQFLSAVRVPIISNLVCRASYWSYLLLIQNSNICSSGAGGHGPCQGDSGGPLYINRNGKNIMIGVVSFGSPAGCAAGVPAAYARTTSYVDFFNQNL